MDGHKPAIGVEEGEILADKYRIERVLGTGGMGVVVAARHIELDERVAIKFLLPDTLDNPEVVARFAREARAAVRIKSEHVARIIDVGRLDSGAPYIIMEYLEGDDLATWLGRRGALPLSQALDFVLQACEAVAAAHALGIIHRDLKPANLFVVKLGHGRRHVKVLDFGISKVLAADASAPSMTQTATMLGSPLYMPPEQMRSAKDVDTRSDIWALGVILHEFISGQPPFAGATMPEVMTQVLDARPPGLRTLVPSVPEALERVVLRCLEKDKTRRYADVGELARALAPFAPERCRAAAERISRILADAGEDSGDEGRGPAPLPALEWPFLGRTRNSWGGTNRGARPSRRWVGIGGAAAVIVAAIVAFAAWSQRARVDGGPAASVAARVDGSALRAPELPHVAPVNEPGPGALAVGESAQAAAPRPSASAGRAARRDAGHRNVTSSTGRVTPTPPAADAPAQPVSKVPRPIVDPFEDR